MKYILRMGMSAKTKRVFSVIICIVLAIALLASCVIPAFADDLSDLEAQQQALEEQQAEQQLLLDATDEQLKEAQAAVDNAVAELSALDDQMAEVNQKISDLGDKIEVNEELLTETQAQLDEQRAELKTYYSRFKSRIQMMYETNQTSYLEVLLSASSIADLFSRLEYISEVVKYDNGIIEEMNRVEESIAATKEAIQQTTTELEQDQASEEEEKANLQTIMDQKQDEIDELNSNALAVALMKEQQQSVMDNIQAEIDSTQEAIDAENSRIEEESRQLEEARQAAIAAQEAAAAAAAAAASGSDDDEDDGDSSNSSSIPEAGVSTDADSRALSYGWQSWPGIGNGYFYWPVDCYLISSLFGPRIHPITGEYSNHGGLDIAADYGQPIYAAASGTVIESSDGWNGGWGNYIKIDHGNGLCTLYAHQSERVAQVGDYVTTGEVIGYVGSTGMSTGPHLHFEVYVDGVRVNPEDWL